MEDFSRLGFVPDVCYVVCVCTLLEGEPYLPALALALTRLALPYVLMFLTVCSEVEMVILPGQLSVIVVILLSIIDLVH